MTFDDVPLRRLAECLDGKRVPLNREQRADMAGDVPYWGSGGVVDHIDEQLFDEPLVLLGEDGAPFFDSTRPVSFVIDGPSWVNNHIHVLRPRAIEPRFLSYALNAVDYGRYISGSTRDKLTQEEMWTIRIPRPGRDEQRRIADFLDDELTRLDELSKLRSQQRSSLQERLASWLDEHLVRRVSGAKPLSLITDPARPIQYGIVLPGPDFPGGVPIIKGGDIGSGRILTGPLQRTDPAIDAAYARSRVQGGDLVIAIRGSVGELASVPDSLAGANLTQDSARVAPWGVEPRWLLAVLRAPALQGRIQRLVTGATVKGINIFDLRRIPVPTPSLSDQRKLASEVLDIESGTREAVSAIVRSEALVTERKQALITAAVTGLFDVTTAQAVA